MGGGVLRPVGRGARRLAGATTDVWVHEGYAYLGTFNTPCGTGERDEAGVRVFDARLPTRVRAVGSLPSVAGSRVNDIKVMAGVQGDVLVHSNERCGRGSGGFEIYNVDDPLKPVHLAHVQTDSVNASLRDSGAVQTKASTTSFSFQETVTTTSRRRSRRRWVIFRFLISPTRRTSRAWAGSAPSVWSGRTWTGKPRATRSF